MWAVAKVQAYCKRAAAIPGNKNRHKEPMTPDEKKDLWHTYHRFYKSRVKAYTPKINEALKKQVQQYINARKAGKGDEAALLSVKSAPIIAVLKPLYYDAGITYGAKAVSYLRRQKARMPIGFNALMIQLVTRYFETELLNVVETISKTTRDKIRDVLIESYPLGRSFDEIVDILTEKEFTAIRARLITRTETNTAANTGAMLAVKTTGLQVTKTWISAQDNRTRRVPRDHFDHLHMNDVEIPYSEPFNVTGKLGNELMSQPGDIKAKAANRCNCRCTVGFSGVRDANGRLIRTT